MGTIHVTSELDKGTEFTVTILSYAQIRMEISAKHQFSLLPLKITEI